MTKPTGTAQLNSVGYAKGRGHEEECVWCVCNLEGVNGKNKGEYYQNTQYAYIKFPKKYIKEEKFKIRTFSINFMWL